MTITVQTTKLIELIGDLKHTTNPDPDMGAVNGILLHTARGYHVPGEPGMGDILVGTSTTHYTVGHTYVPCYGQMSQAMLWPLASALLVVNAFKPLVKDNKEHTLELAFDGTTVHVQGEKDLFDTGDVFEFKALSTDKFPRGLWNVLRWSDNPGQSGNGESDTAQLPRVDFPAAGWAQFAAVANNHKEIIETYTYHQRRPVQIAIGARYCGAIIPQRWGDDKHPQAGRAPDVDVFAPDLPPVDDTKPQVDTESMLEQAADVVLSAQLASPSMLTRKLRIKTAEASTLLDELELLGVVGPANGSKARDVLVPSNMLGMVLAKIRATRVQEPTLDEDAEPEVPEVVAGE